MKKKTRFHRLFLSRGANVFLRNREGETPPDCCSHNSKAWAVLQANRKERGSNSSMDKAEEKVLHRLNMSHWWRKNCTFHFHEVTSIFILRSLTVPLSSPMFSDIALGHERVPIPCVNAVDSEPYPEGYKYIPENCVTSPMNIDRNITHMQVSHPLVRCFNRYIDIMKYWI